MEFQKKKNSLGRVLVFCEKCKYLIVLFKYWQSPVWITFGIKIHRDTERHTGGRHKLFTGPVC